jgi:hypothetical protein
MYFEEQEFDDCGTEHRPRLRQEVVLASNSRIADVITMLMVPTHSVVQVPLQSRDSQVMKKYVRMCMRIAPSMGMEVKHDSGFDHAVLHDAVPHGHQRSATRGEDAKTRCNGCQKVYYCCRGVRSGLEATQDNMRRCLYGRQLR